MDEQSASDAPSPQPGEPIERKTQWEILLEKYVAVWLWSILFGTTTGVLFSFLSFRADRWGTLGLLLLLPAGVSLLLAIFSWVHLYQAFAGFLLPQFVTHAPIDVVQDTQRFAYHLRRAFFFFICATGFRMVVALCEMLLSTTGSIG